MPPASGKVPSTSGNQDQAAPDASVSAQGYLSCSAAFDQLAELETPEGVGNGMDCAYGETLVTLEVSSYPLQFDEQLLEAARGKSEPFWAVTGENWIALGRSSDASEAASFAKEFGGEQR